jgi:hypothetical protein
MGAANWFMGQVKGARLMKQVEKLD